VSEVVPEDEDRGGDGAIHPDAGSDDDNGGHGGTGSDDGGPGSQNM
jgi:hypothetical protein